MTTSIFTRIWDLRSIRLTEGSDGFSRSWIMLFPQGTYHHPEYGKLDFSAASLREFKKNFDTRVRGIEISLDENHDQNKATGWLEEVQIRPATGDLPAGLWGRVRWTELGEHDIKAQIYRYFSPEFGPHFDEKTGRKTPNVILGGGLTNRPFLKDMPAVALKERKSGMAATKKKLAAKGKPVDDAEDDDAEAMADDAGDETDLAEDDEEAMDEADGDNEDDGDGDEPDVPPSKGKPGTGKFAPRDFTKPGNPKMASKGKSKKATEPPRGEVMTLREQVATMRRQLFEQQVNQVLDGWEAGKSFSFDEQSGAVKDPDAASERSNRKGRIAMTPKARRAIEGFLLSEGYTLSEGTRASVLDLVQSLLSESMVDLSARSRGSFDMEDRKTIHSPRRDDNGTDAENDVVRTADRLARRQFSKSLSELTFKERERVMIEAATQVGY